jgi:hypothetical protein
MHHTYYIVQNNEREGPYDLLSMIRKIKNGRISRRSMVAVDAYEDPKEAEHYPQLLEVIEDQEKLSDQSTPDIDKGITIFSAFRNGWEMFQMNQVTALITGLFAMIALFGIMFLSVIPSAALQGALSAVWGYFVFNMYLIVLSRKARMQLIHNDFYTWLLRRSKPIFLFSLLGSIVPGVLPALLYGVIGKPAVFLVFVPGLLVVTYLLFVPLVIVDQNVGIKEALAINARKMKEAGIDFYSVIFGLVAVNIIPLFPVTMPVSLGAACDSYDRVYNGY